MPPIIGAPEGHSHPAKIVERLDEFGAVVMAIHAGPRVGCEWYLNGDNGIVLRAQDVTAIACPPAIVFVHEVIPTPLQKEVKSCRIAGARINIAVIDCIRGRINPKSDAHVGG